MTTAKDQADIRQLLELRWMVPVQCNMSGDYPPVLQMRTFVGYAWTEWSAVPTVDQEWCPVCGGKDGEHKSGCQDGSEIL